MRRPCLKRFLTTLCLGALVGASGEGAETGRPPAILFMSAHVERQAPGNPNQYRLRSFLPDATLQDRLREWGYVWTADFFCTGMTWEFLQQFNAVVALDFPSVERNRDTATEMRAVQALLRRYVEAGGGLLLTGSTEANQWGLERNTEELNRFLQPYGAEVLIEQVDEPNPLLCLPRPHRLGSISRLAWTGNVTPHALTEGVAGFLYPVDHGSMCYYTHPLQAGTDWTVLLRGSPTARSVTARLGAGTENATRAPGRCTESPALLAVRAAGKGRLALWPMVPTATLIDGYHEFWGSGIIMTPKDTQHPSCGERLLQNLFAWLTAPSRGTFGGYQASPPAEEEEVGLKAVDWERLALPARHYPNCYRGLIGLRSSLSVGRDSPETLLAAAREAGYAFAAFSEDLRQLDEPELEALKATCARLSTDAFRAFAGFVYRDASGNAWQVFSNDLHWPKDDWWHDKQARTLVKNNVVFRGYQFVPLILVHPSLNPEKPWFQGNFKGLALYTYEAGRLVDDATAVHARLQADDYKLFPVVVHFADSAADVRRAASPDLPQTYVPWHELTDVISAGSRTSPQYRGAHVHQWPQFVSSGPRLESFRVINFGTSDLAIPGNDRWRLHLHVSSPKGLREVRISDGPDLWRRFLPAGQTDWTVEIDGFHDRNRHFMVQATDAAGGTLWSGCVGTSVQELNVPRCTDNLNTFTSGKFKAEAVFPLRGLENYIPRQSGTFSYFPKLPGVNETERPAIDQRLTQVSRFGYIRTDGFDHAYPPTATSNWNLNDLPEVAQPQTAITGQTVTTLFTPWADGTSVFHVRGEFEVRRDLDLPRREAVVCGTQWLEDAETFVIAYKDRPTLCACLKPRQRSRRGTCDGLEYVANIAPFEGARGLVPLSPGMEFAAMQQGDSAVSRSALITFLKFPEPVLKAGSRHAYEYLMVFSEVGDKADSRFVEDLFSKMGLRGGPAYRVTPTQGLVKDTRFVLQLEARDGGFRGTVAGAELPLPLPCFIAGLNPRWPAGIWYRGRQTFLVPTWDMDRVHNRYSKRTRVADTDRLVRFGVRDGRGMLQIDTQFGDKEVFIGNLLICDPPEAFLELDRVATGTAVVSVNNPTDTEMTVTVRPGPGFDLAGDFAKTLTVPAGGLVKVSTAK